jgi:lipoprotein-anchoring transpeptidase ErfK/SrfK
MKARSIVRRVLPALVAVAFVVLSLAIASPAMAAPAALTTITVTAAGQTFTHDASTLATVGPPAAVTTASVTAWVDALAGSVNRSPKNATRKINKGKHLFSFTAPVIGRTLNRTAAQALIITELLAEANGSSPTTITLPFTTTNPKVMKFGMAILVSQARTWIYLYSNNKVVAHYRCAVGMRAYPTPYGTFHIGKKNPHPSWHNGYASWSRNMPAYIGPGPNNPLGTRAMYVYTGAGPKGGHDTGVRIHGVPSSENSSIGHRASHGCLRMHRKDVEKLYPKVKLGTIVYIIK